MMLAAAPSKAFARAHKKKAAANPIRPEDDPLLAGDARAFAKAHLAFVAPGEGAEVAASGGVPVQLELCAYALGPAPSKAEPTASADGGTPNDAPPTPTAVAAPAPFALLIVDNDAALRIDQTGTPLRLTGLTPGPHLLRAVLSRPWGEVVKARDAFAMVRFWVGPRPTDPEAAQAQEAKVWPDTKHPVLTYVFPLGELREGLSLVADESLPPAPSLDGSIDAGSASNPPASIRPLPATTALDFYLSGAQLKPHGRADKVRVVIDKRELPMIRAWKPMKLPLKPGRNHLTIDLLDRRSTKVKNAVNRTDRTITLPTPAGP
jgi:hypothetical protein